MNMHAAMVRYDQSDSACVQVYQSTSPETEEPSSFDNRYRYSADASLDEIFHAADMVQFDQKHVQSQ
jgi:hypothetical protein